MNRKNLHPYVSPEARTVACRIERTCLTTSIQNVTIDPVEEEEWGNF